MAELRWTLSATEDLRLLEEWIAKDSPLNAVDFIDRLVASAEKLTSSPLIGRLVPEFSKEGLRELIFRGYRIVYSAAPTQVTVFRVVHGARDLRALIEREPWTSE